MLKILKRLAGTNNCTTFAVKQVKNAPINAPNMRTTTPIIRIVLRTNKTLADGTNPIMLRVSFHGMKERATGFSATPKQWDAKREQLKAQPNVNAMLRGMKERAIEAMESLLQSGQYPSPEAILEKTFKRPTNDRRDLQGLVERYIEDNPKLSPATRRSWKSFALQLRDFSPNMLIDSVNDTVMQQFGLWLEQKGLKHGTIRLYMSKFFCLARYAYDMKIVTSFPVRRYSYTRRYEESKRQTYIHEKAMNYLFQTYYDAATEIIDGKRQLKPKHPNKKEYALYLFLLGYTLKGLAPVDVQRLEKSDFKMAVIDGKNYYAIDGRRRKTNQPYKVRLAMDHEAVDVLITQMLNYSPDQHFLKRAKSNWKYKIDTLREWLREANKAIEEQNQQAVAKVPLIDVNAVTYYTYRHSYLMAQLTKKDANWLKIAAAMGKSPTTLHQYVSELRDEDLI